MLFEMYKHSENILKLIMLYNAMVFHTCIWKISAFWHDCTQWPSAMAKGCIFIVEKKITSKGISS